MSQGITERRIGTISKNVANNLCVLENCTASSLSFDKSTVIQDVPQLAIIINYLNPDVNVKEEMLYQVTFIETTRSIDIIYVLYTHIINMLIYTCTCLCSIITTQ